MGNILTSFIRTLVPTLVGAVVAFLVARGLIDAATAPETAAQITSVVTPIAIGLYYAVARWLESKVDGRFGWLLGLAKAPGYSAAQAPPARPSPGPNPD